MRALATIVPLCALLLVVLLTDADDASAARLGAYDATADAGLEWSGHTYGTLAADFDGDGDEDLLEVRHYAKGGPVLYENLGDGTYADRGPAFEGLKREDVHGCDAADVNQDGHLDVYCALGGKKGGTGPNDKRLFLAQPLGGYEEVAKEWGVRDRYGRGREVSFIDANGDEYPDLFVGNQPNRKDGRQSPNRFFLNRGGERFAEKPSYGLNGKYGADFDAQAVDYDRDGAEDLLVCARTGLHLFRNRGGSRGFEDVSDSTGYGGSCHSAVLAQFGGDRDLDLAVLDNDGLGVSLARNRGFSRPVHRDRAQDGRAIAAGDVDLDGRDDIYLLRHGRYVKDSDHVHRNDRTDLILRNRGRGTSFARSAAPPIRRGVGQSVTTVAYGAEERDAFLVMNGFNKAEGPVRLIAFGNAGRGKD